MCLVKNIFDGYVTNSMNDKNLTRLVMRWCMAGGTYNGDVEDSFPFGSIASLTLQLSLGFYSCFAVRPMKQNSTYFLWRIQFGRTQVFYKQAVHRKHDINVMWKVDLLVNVTKITLKTPIGYGNYRLKKQKNCQVPNKFKRKVKNQNYGQICISW